MKVNGYINYGVLAHEFEDIYTVGTPAEAIASDPVTLDIPDTLSPYTSVSGIVCIQPDDSDYPYTIDEVLRSRDDAPFVEYINKHGVLREVAINIA